MSFDISPVDRSTVDAIPISPPAEVHQAMAVADERYRRLAAAGCALSFELDRPTGRVQIEVHDLEGNVLFTIAPSTALAIAAGEGLATIATGSGICRLAEKS